MPLDLAALAVSTALSALARPVAKGVLGSLYEKLGRLTKRQSPLQRVLSGAYRQAWQGFEGTLRAALYVDQPAEYRLKQLAESAVLGEALAQLAVVPFDAIDIGDLRQRFQELAPSGAEDADFDAAWRAAGNRFRRAAAENDELKRLVDSAYQWRQEEREEEKLAHQQRVEELLGRLVDANEAAAPVRDEAPAIEGYRQGLFERFRYADTRGLFLREKEGVGEGIELAEVFVETPLDRIVEHKPQAAELDEQAEIDEAEQDADPLLRRDRSSAAQETLTLGEIVARERLTVVLGDPGSGKSTLTRCLALTLCRPEDEKSILDHGLPEETVPILLQLKEFASALRREPSAKLDEFLFEHCGGKLPNAEALLDDGRALVLLDGLDEVFDETDRRWVSDEVWRLMTDHPRTRFVLTSRPHGYRAAPLPGPVPRWELQLFDDDAIGHFFTSWFRALARAGGEAGATESPDDRAKALHQEVTARPRLRAMAQNPLLCTLIVLVHRSRSGQLPQRRFVFYEAAVRTMAELWEKWKFHPERFGREELTYPEPDTLLRGLAEVAWRAFHELGRREIPGEVLREWLAEYLARQPEWGKQRGEQAAKDLLLVVRDRLGLLVDLGGDVYQFVHLSLHEYLVAHFLLDRLTEEQCNTVLRHYLHVPEWKEALRLTVGGAPQARAGVLISSLLEWPTGDKEEVTHRDLLFVGRCLEDRAAVSAEVRAEAGRRFTQAVDGAAGRRLGSLVQFGGGFADDPEVRNAVLQKLGDPHVLYTAIDFFARTAPDDPEVRTAVLQKLDDPNAAVRVSAVAYFTYTALDDPQVRTAVFRCLDDTDRLVRRSAVDYFARLASDDPEVRAAVLQRLDDPNGLVRGAAIDFFAITASDDLEARTAVFRELDDPHEVARSTAVGFFVRTAPDDREVRAALFQKLDRPDESAVRSALEFFARTAPDDPEPRTAVLQKLDDPNPRVRSSAINFFVRTAPDDPEVRTAVLQKLDDLDLRVRSSAVAFFARNAPDDPEVRSAFLQKLDDPDPQVRGSALYFFARSTADDTKVRDTALHLLEENDDAARLYALCFLVDKGLDDLAPRRLWEALEGLPDGLMTAEQNRKLSRHLGWAAASDPDLEELLFANEERALFYFDEAMAAFDTARDESRRRANPLPDFLS